MDLISYLENRKEYDLFVQYFDKFKDIYIVPESKILI